MGRGKERQWVNGCGKWQVWSRRREMSPKSHKRGECRRNDVPAIIYTASFSKDQHLPRVAVVLHGTAAFDFIGIYEPRSWGWDWLSAEQVVAPRDHRGRAWLSFAREWIPRLSQTANARDHAERKARLRVWSGKYCRFIWSLESRSRRKTIIKRSIARWKAKNPWHSGISGASVCSAGDSAEELDWLTDVWRISVGASAIYSLWNKI